MNHLKIVLLSVVLIALYSCAPVPLKPWEKFAIEAKPGTPEFVAREAYAEKFFAYLEMIYADELQHLENPRKHPRKYKPLAENNYVRPLYDYYSRGKHGFKGSILKFVKNIITNRNENLLWITLFKKTFESKNEIHFLIDSSLNEINPIAPILLIKTIKTSPGDWKVSSIYQVCDICQSQGKVKEVSGVQVVCPKCRGAKYLEFSYEYLFKHM